VSPLTHFIGSWLVAAATTKDARDRKLITLAGILPDLDGAGLAVDIAKAVVTAQPNTHDWYARYHHILLHGWPGAIVICGTLAIFAHRRWQTLLLCLLTFHLHLVCDLLGSRGPTTADLWPICYSEPLFRHPIWFWRGQWRLDGWQNTVVFVLVFATALWLATQRGYSFAEILGRKIDAVFVGTLQKWRRQLRGGVE